MNGLPAHENLTNVNDVQCYNVTIIDDMLVETKKSFFVEFSIMGGADVAVVGENRTEITILDNDGKLVY